MLGQISTMMRALRRCLHPIALLALVSGALDAQAIDPARQDSLVALLPSDLRDRGREVVREADPDKRAAALNKLSQDESKTPNADSHRLVAFTLGLARWDPSAKVRGAILWQLGIPPYSTDPGTPKLLTELAAKDPSAAVALQALELVRSSALDTLSRLLQQRLALAKTSRDTALPQLLEEAERWISLKNGTMLPAFMRATPPVFAAAPKSKSSIRALAFGDYGTGSPDQKAAALAMQGYHKQHPFDFGLTLGDNFYSEGMTSPRDPRWGPQFEDLYAPLGIKLYAAFGNHDWYGPDSPAAELLYAKISKVWTMPAPYYTFTAGPVQFFALDTNEMSDKQLAWLDSAIKVSTAKWKIAYGHHQIYSATRKDNPELIAKLVPLLDHRVDVFICGHDHNLQALKPENGVHYFVAGAGGAGTYETDPQYPRSLVRFETYGFAVIEGTAQQLTVRLIDKNRAELYATTIKK